MEKEQNLKTKCSVIVDMVTVKKIRELQNCTVKNKHVDSEEADLHAELVDSVRCSISHYHSVDDWRCT
jgi:hypothetical protein